VYCGCGRKANSTVLRDRYKNLKDRFGLSKRLETHTLSIRFNIRNVVIWFVKAKCVAGKVKPIEEIGLKLLHKTFAVFT